MKMGCLVTVHNLRTDEEKSYVGLRPVEAVVAAYAQERGDWNTWEYNKYHSQVISGQITFSIGDWCVLKHEKSKHVGNSERRIHRRCNLRSIQ